MHVLHSHIVAFIALTFVAFGHVALAQDIEVQLLVEPEVVHSGMEGLEALDGFTTYRLYLTGLGASDKVTAVYGIEETPLEIHASGEVFQSPFNVSWSASGVNPAFVGVIPELIFDSYATIGIDGPASAAQNAGFVDPSLVESLDAPIEAFFTTPGLSDLTVNSSIGSSVYVLPNSSNGLPDDEGRVLLFQLTCTGLVEGSIPIQVLLNGDGAQARFWQFPFSGEGLFSATSACVSDQDGDGVCDAQEILGCMNEDACNFDEIATESDDSCQFPEEGKDCDGNCVVDFDGDGECDTLEDWAANVHLRVEEWHQHDSTLVGLEGATTFRVYLSSLQPTDVVSAIFGIEEEPLFIHTPEGIYNSPFNPSPTAAGLNSLLYSFAPEAEFDSYITIGLDQSASTWSGGAVDPEVLDADGSIGTYFSTPDADSLHVSSSTGSVVYLLNEAENGIAGTQGEVLILQLTTTGSISGRIPVQMFFSGNGDLAAARVFEFDGVGEFSSQSSCAYLPGVDCDSVILGCTDPAACNFNEAAETDDGSCATLDDCGICGGDGSTCLGCTDSSACNFDPAAMFDDGSCASVDVLGVCGGNCQFDNNENGICDTNELGSSGFCGEGTVWSEDLQQCVLAVPPYVVNADGVPSLNICYLDVDQSGSVGLSDLLDMLTAFNNSCPQ